MKAQVRHAFLAIEDEANIIYDRLMSFDCEKVISVRSERTLIYFKGFANRPLPANEADPQTLPMIWFVRPIKKRGVLWTTGEVRFTPLPLRPQFPGLDNINRALAKWFEQFDLVFSRKDPHVSEWDYFLECGCLNFFSKIYALPRAARALRDGQYFVYADANDATLDTFCNSLRLRGVEAET